MEFSTLIFSLFIWICVTGVEGARLCAYMNRDVAKDTDDDIKLQSANLHFVNEDEDWDILPDNRTMRCATIQQNCFTWWMPDPNVTNGIIILKQGCWNADDKTCNPNGMCPSNGTMVKPDTTRFCCCQGNMCNENVTDNLVPGMYSTSTPRHSSTQHTYLVDPAYREKTVIIALASVCFVAVVTVLVYLMYRMYWLGRAKQPPDALHLVESPSTPALQLDDLKLCVLVGRGRYGEVWKGILCEQEVAVKIFLQKQYYYNEKDIYSLPFMEHDCLPRYYGSEERITADGINQYLIVMSYVPGGTLMEYLKENTIDWITLCKMTHSIARGLAHLHTDITKGGKVKPAIAHRDLNSRNILVRWDLTCVVCDLSFAMKIMGAHFVRNGQEENAEESSLTDVGTIRYMAPEVLDGAVNLRDCESSLKQIDVYSLGLLLWEIGSRCVDLYQGLPVPEYSLPFQAELGAHPSFEAMQLLVSRNKCRPVFPDVWKDTNPAIRALKETIDDSWDQDAEARLTSLCVEERTSEMFSMWPNRHKGVTPTVESLAEKGIGLYQWNPTQTSPTSQVITEPVTPAQDDLDREDTNGNVPLLQDCQRTDNQINVVNANQRQSVSSQQEYSVSSVTETTMLSPSEPGGSESTGPITYGGGKADCNVTMAQSNSVNRVLHPHQGQNPTVERNTHKRSDEELTILGNTLVDKRNSQPPQRGDVELAEQLFDTLADNLQTSLVSSDILNDVQHRPALPGRSLPPPYQAHLHHHSNISQPLIVRPKQPNVPGNGVQKDKKRKSRFPKFWKSRDKGGRLGLSLFGRSGRQEAVLENEDDSMPTENLISQAGLKRHSQNMGPRMHQQLQQQQSSSHHPTQQLATEVCLVNGAPVVRPTSLPLQCSGDLEGGEDRASARLQPNEREAVEEEPAVSVSNSNSTPLANMQPTSTTTNTQQDEGDANHNVLYDEDSLSSPPSNHINTNSNKDNRPNTGRGGAAKNIDNNKKGRLSLCDDRVMSLGSIVSPDTTTTDNVVDSKLATSSISLQQFNGSERDVSAVHATEFQC